MANSKNKPSTNLPEYLFERLIQYVEPGQQLCVALSGGVDSVALLHAANAAAPTLKCWQVKAFHVNHGLSPNAGEWETFCRRLCGQLGIPLEVRQVEVKPGGEGIEAAARRQRYAALMASECDWVLLGHHRDDQAETVLLNLLRGSGVHGAAGMAEKRDQLLRPFLDVPRTDIVAYARGKGLFWIEDESNDNIQYSRNFLRHRIMPLLEQPFPGAVASLARAARAFGDAAELLDQLAEADLDGEKRLNVTRLKAMSPLRGANLLAYYLRRQNIQIPSRAMLLEILRQLVTGAGDSKIFFPVGGQEIRHFRDHVWVDIPALPVQSIAWSGSEIAWGSHLIRQHAVMGEGIDSSVLRLRDLRLSPRGSGDSMQLSDNRPRRPLKDLLREAGIPPWRRKTLPVLYAGDEVVWVAGIGIAAKYRCKPGTEGFLIEFDGVTW